MTLQRQGAAKGVATTAVKKAMISVNHAQVMAEVNRLRGVATELSTLHTNAQKAVRNMSGSWEGEAANAFLASNERWCVELKDIESEITSLAALIQKVADEMREADRRVKAAMKSL